EGFDIEAHDTSVLSGKTMAQIAGAEDSAEWQSSKKASRGRVKAAWLADSLAKLDKKKRKPLTTEATEEHGGNSTEDKKPSARSKKHSSTASASSAVKD